MEGGIADQDYKEFDMLLGEIPDATSGYPLTGKPCLIGPSLELDIKEPFPTNKAINLSSPRSKDTKLYKSPPSSTNIGCMPIYGSVVFLNSADNQKFQSKGNGGYEIPEVFAGKENSDLPDDKPFALSFEGMSIKDNPEEKASTTASVKNNHSSSSHTCLLNVQCTKHLNMPLFGYDSVDMNFPPFTLNQISLSSIELEAQASVMRRNGLVNLRDKKNGQNNVKLFEPYGYEPNQVSENILGNLSENQQFPQNAMDMPVNPGMDSHQPFRSVHGVQLPNACQPYFYADANRHIAQPGMVRHSMEEERCSQSCELYAHHLQNNRLEVLQTQKSMQWAMEHLNGIAVPPSFEFLAPHQLECCNQNPYLNANRLYDKSNQLYCQYQLGLSGRVENYWSSNGHKLLPADGLSCSSIDSHGPQGFDKVVNQCFPEKILTRSQRVNSVRIHRSNPLTADQSLLHDEKNVRWSYGHAHQLHGLSNGSLELYNHRGTSPDNFVCGHASKLMHRKYNSVDEVVGRIYLLAKDQHGCRFLQRKLSEGSQEDIDRIYSEIICHIVELMFDPFGNYLVQKLLELCNEEQMNLILKIITRNTGELVRISFDVHGTRAVQKVIESLQTPAQISMVLSSLEPDIVSLMKNINGNHVAQRCLQCLSTYSEFLIDAAIAHCVELATDKQGCCVLQNCLKHSDADQKQRLMTVISSYSLVLSLDPFGNYVVQFVLLQKVPWATATVLNQLKGNYEHLSMQKYSSNVVEKCLKLAGKDNFVKIIEELMSSPRLYEILRDKFGNYVMQSALGESKAHGDLHTALVEAIRPHIPALRNSPFGKNILSCSSLSSLKNIKRIVKPKENHRNTDALGPRHANSNGLSI